MRGRLLPLVVLSVAAHAQVTLQLTPAAPVKGRDTEAILEISTDSDRPAPPVLRANVGSIEGVERLRAGRYRARYVLPPTRAPEVAIIVAFAPWPHPQSVDGAFGVLRVPMASAVEVPGRAEPGAEVRLSLGETTFGPVRAQSDGTFKLPVVVPPGFGVATTTTVDRVGNKRSAKLDLLLPRVDQLACVATPTTLPADGTSKTRILCASSDQHGGATKGAKVRWTGGHGAWSVAKELGDGMQEWMWTAPRELGSGVETLRASWKQRAVDSSEELRLTLSQGPVRALELEAEDRVAHQGGRWSVLARARDAFGRPLAGVTVRAPGFAPVVTGANGDARLEWRLATNEALGARAIDFTAAGPEGAEPAQLNVWRSGEETLAQVIDLSGLPVPRQKLLAGGATLVTGADGTAVCPAASEVVHAEWPGLRAVLPPTQPLPTVTARVQVTIAPAPGVNVRVARAKADFEWWLETSEGTIADDRAVEIRDGRGARRVVSHGKTHEPYAGLTSITDVETRVTAVVEAAQ